MHSAAVPSNFSPLNGHELTHRSLTCCANPLAPTSHQMNYYTPGKGKNKDYPKYWDDFWAFVHPNTYNFYECVGQRTAAA